MADNWLIRKLFHFWFLLRRPMTLGVRVLVENEHGEVLLVRHTYVTGWYFPGGGIEIGDHSEATARKELFEETGLDCRSEMHLVGVFYNRKTSRRDHVVFYRCSERYDTEHFKRNKEIEEVGFFSINHLPTDVSPATKRRLREVFQGETQSAYW